MADPRYKTMLPHPRIPRPVRSLNTLRFERQGFRVTEDRGTFLDRLLLRPRRLLRLFNNPTCDTCGRRLDMHMIVANWNTTRTYHCSIECVMKELRDWRERMRARG